MDFLQLLNQITFKCIELEAMHRELGPIAAVSDASDKGDKGNSSHIFRVLIEIQTRELVQLFKTAETNLVSLPLEERKNMRQQLREMSETFRGLQKDYINVLKASIRPRFPTTNL